MNRIVNLALRKRGGYSDLIKHKKDMNSSRVASFLGRHLEESTICLVEVFRITFFVALRMFVGNVSSRIQWMDVIHVFTITSDQMSMMQSSCYNEEI